MFPLLSLRQIKPDADLVRRLPRRLAYYHQALPIAQDDDYITVALAYPGRAAVIDVLRNVLGMAVKAVRSDPDEIRAALDVVWEEADQASATAILLWGGTPAQEAQARRYAEGIAPALAFECDAAAVVGLSLDDVLRAARAIAPALIVAAVPDPLLRQELVHRASAPVLLIQDDAVLPRTILHVLRGHPSDRTVLDWLIPLAHHFAASVTVLAAATPIASDPRQGSPLTSDFANLLMRDHPTRLIEFGQTLASVNIDGRLRIRQGLLEAAIASELSATPYDLIAITTEAYGNFVNRVLQHLPATPGALLVVKPQGWSVDDRG